MANNSLIPYNPPQKNWKEILKSKLNFKINYNYVSVCSFIGVLLLAGFGRFWHDAPVTPVENVVTVSQEVQNFVPKKAEKSKKAKLITGKSVTPPAIPKMGTEAYIAKFKDAAILSYKKTGVLPSITLAQGILESNAGNSGGVLTAHNHFGIKCNANPHRWCCVKARDDSNADSFKIFKSDADCYDGHGWFLKNNKRYAKLFTFGKNYRKWAYELKRAGYATDKGYAQKIIKVIETYNLHRFDK
jgi:flagellum-specific peptidoglycan hydrolase FlgJ